jgi:membrane protein DedA with SNARE-associated domain
MHMPWRRFFVADLVGSGLWVGVWVLGLDEVGRHPAWVHRLLLHLNPWVAGGSRVGLAIVLFLLLRRPAPRPSV